MHSPPCLHSLVSLSSCVRKFSATATVVDVRLNLWIQINLRTMVSCIPVELARLFNSGPHRLKQKRLIDPEFPLFMHQTPNTSDLVSTLRHVHPQLADDMLHVYHVCFSEFERWVRDAMHRGLGRLVWKVKIIKIMSSRCKLAATVMIGRPIERFIYPWCGRFYWMSWLLVDQ